MPYENRLASAYGAPTFDTSNVLARIAAERDLRGVPDPYAENALRAYVDQTIYQPEQAIARAQDEAEAERMGRFFYGPDYALPDPETRQNALASYHESPYGRADQWLGRREKDLEDFWHRTAAEKPRKVGGEVWPMQAAVGAGTALGRLGLMGGQSLTRWASQFDPRYQSAAMGGQEMFAVPGAGGFSGLAAHLAGRIPPNALGTFGGKVAARNLAAAGNTAPQRALELAERMHAQGASRDEIWKATADLFRTESPHYAGVKIQPDGQPAFEISDSASRWQLYPEPKPGESISTTLGQALHHPEFYKAYPGSENLPLQYVNVLNPPKDAPHGLYNPGTQSGMVRAGTTSDPRSVALHEFGGHHVQNVEGFPQGASWKSIPTEMIAQERARLNALAAQEGPHSWTSVGTVATDLSDEAIARQLYHRLVGEVEARNVQARLKLNVLDRPRTPPWLTEDLPATEQIVRFLSGGGAQMSMEPPKSGTVVNALDRPSLPMPEVPNRAAVRVGDSVIEGPNHYEAALRANDVLAGNETMLNQLAAGEYVSGFLTDRGRFIDRQEALALAAAAAGPQSYAAKIARGPNAGFTSEMLDALEWDLPRALDRPSLPMDEGSRLARAREMGFDTENAWYHGSADKFQAFDRSYLGDTTGAADARTGFHFAGSSADADFYATMAKEKATRGESDIGYVGEYYLGMRKPLVLSPFDNEVTLPRPLVDKLMNDKIAAAEYARQNGYDGVIYKHGTDVDSGPTAVVFDPSHIRSPQAAFDPSQASSPNLLASNPWTAMFPGITANAQDRR